MNDRDSESYRGVGKDLPLTSQRLHPKGCGSSPPALPSLTARAFLLHPSTIFSHSAPAQPTAPIHGLDPLCHHPIYH